MPNRLIPTEAAEQEAIMDWAHAMTPRFPCLRLLYASQAGARVSWKQAKSLKRQGMKRGLPDLHLPVARNGVHGLWIELKRRKGGRVSLEQLWWHQQLRRECHAVHVCKGATEAIDVLFHYVATEEAPAA